MFRQFFRMAAAGATILSSYCAIGQTFPNAPVRIFTSEIGGGVDIVARIVADGLGPRLGQPVIVENRGGSAIIPAQIVAKAPADGHTMLFYGSPIWLLPLLQATPYDPIKDFAPVILAASSPNILVVNPSLPATSVRELIALAKAQPGKLNYAAGVAGSSAHLAAELFKAMAGVQITRISYKGSAAGLTAVIADQVQMMFAIAAQVPAQVKAGKLRALAVTSAKPSTLAPGLPSMAEQGLPGYEAILDLGVYAPAGTPSARIERLNRDIAQVLFTNDAKEKLFRAGFEPVGSSAEQLLASVKSETAKWGKLIKEAGIRAD